MKQETIESFVSRGIESVNAEAKDIKEFQDKVTKRINEGLKKMNSWKPRLIGSGERDET